MSQKIRKMKPRKQGEADSRSVRIAWVVGALGLCILLVAGVIIATGDDGRKNKRITAQEESTAPATPNAASSAPTTKLTLEQVQVPPLSIYRRRNPFEPLVNMDSMSAGTSPGTPGTGVAGGSRVVRVPEQLRGGTNPPPEVLSRAVTLDGVTRQDGKPLVRIRVGDELYDNISVGQTFGVNYKLLSVGDDSSATILYGDERFTVFTGQSIYL